MKFIALQSCIVSIFFMLSCDPGDGKLTLINNSNDTLYYQSPSCGDSIISFPISLKNDKIDALFSNMILPKKEHRSITMDSWEDFINKDCKDSIVRIFFFDKTLIKTAGKDSIMKHQLYSQKFKLKVKDLEKMNWRVVYDGN